MLNAPGTGDWAFETYQTISTRLPRGTQRGACARAEDLAQIAQDFDLILFDAYGVLNVGESPIATAPPRIAALRAAGKPVRVVTNSAGYPKVAMMARYARLGFDFTVEEVISSRQTTLTRMKGNSHHWGAMLSARYGNEDMGGLDFRFLQDDPADYAAVEGFLLIGADDWSATRQGLLEVALHDRPRPVVVGNPDLIAPRETGFSLEPGYFAHQLMDKTGCRPEFYGKPFPDIFDLALATAPDAERVLMVGDTLHTDIAGAQAKGISAALVLENGMMQGLDVDAAIAASGIHPDFILQRA